MASFKVEISKVLTNGPYAYLIFKNGAGQKSVNNVATISAALDGVKADIGGMLGGEGVDEVRMQIASS